MKKITGKVIGIKEDPKFDHILLKNLNDYFLKDKNHFDVSVCKVLKAKENISAPIPYRASGYRGEKEKCPTILFNNINNPLSNMRNASLVDGAHNISLDKLNGNRFLLRYYERNRYQIGEFVEGKGIYIGEWDSAECNLCKVSKKFNLFAAPEDLAINDINQITTSSDNKARKTFTYYEAYKHLSHVSDWYGHDGSTLKYACDIYRAIETDSYNQLEKWFIPTGYMIYNFFYKNRLKGRLKQAFSNGSKRDYWTSTTDDMGWEYANCQYFPSGTHGWQERHLGCNRVRPVRAELKQQSYFDLTSGGLINNP